MEGPRSPRHHVNQGSPGPSRMRGGAVGGGVSSQVPSSPYPHCLSSSRAPGVRSGPGGSPSSQEPLPRLPSTQSALGARGGLVHCERPQRKQDRRCASLRRAVYLLTLSSGTRRAPWSPKGLVCGGPVTLFLPRMGPSLANELRYDGKERRAGCGPEALSCAALNSSRRDRKGEARGRSHLASTYGRVTDGVRI